MKHVEYGYSIVRSRIEPGESDETPAMQTLAIEVQQVFDERVIKGWRLFHASDVLLVQPRGKRHGYVQQHFTFERELATARTEPVSDDETQVSFTTRRVKPPKSLGGVLKQLLSGDEKPET